MTLSVIEQGLKRLHSLPDDFEFFHWEVLQRSPMLLKLTGGICPAKRKNKRHLTLLHYHEWKARDKAQDQTFYVLGEQEQRFIDQYTQETGNCPKCQGQRVEVQSCGVLKALPIRDDGEGSYTTYRTCSKCNGTGRAA